MAKLTKIPKFKPGEIIEIFINITPTGRYIFEIASIEIDLYGLKYMWDSLKKGEEYAPVKGDIRMIDDRAVKIENEQLVRKLYG